MGDSHKNKTFIVLQLCLICYFQQPSLTQPAQKSSLAGFNLVYLKGL